MSDLTDAELMVLSSVQVYQTRPGENEAIGFGSGFMAEYLGRLFFISVAHVTDKGDLDNYLETNIYDSNQKAWMWKKIGGFCYFSLLDASHVTAPEELLELLETGKDERLDICFAEVNTAITLIQPAIDFVAFQVPRAEKITLNLDYIAVPDSAERYGFYGRVRHDPGPRVLKSEPTLKHSLKFHRAAGDFYIFLAPDIIKDEYDYRGCSGAPVLDSQQLLVGVTSAIRPDTKMIYAFSIQKCKQLIDYALQMGMLGTDQASSGSEESA